MRYIYRHRGRLPPHDGEKRPYVPGEFRVADTQSEASVLWNGIQVEISRRESGEGIELPYNSDLDRPGEEAESYSDHSDVSDLPDDEDYGRP